MEPCDKHCESLAEVNKVSQIEDTVSHKCFQLLPELKRIRSSQVMTVKYHSTIRITATVMKTQRSSCVNVRSVPRTVRMFIASSMRPFRAIFCVKTQMRLSSRLAPNSAIFRFSSRTRAAAAKGRPSKDPGLDRLDIVFKFIFLGR